MHPNSRAHPSIASRNALRGYEAVHELVVDHDHRFGGAALHRDPVLARLLQSVARKHRTAAHENQTLIP